MVLLVILFLSCTDQDMLPQGLEKPDPPNIHDIVSMWIDIEKSFTASFDANSIEALNDTIDVFYLSLQQFQGSTLFHTYRAILFSPHTERNLMTYPLADIQEAGIASDLALVFRDAIVSGDTEKARAVSDDISRLLIRLLKIDADAQRYVANSYFRLLFSLIIFVIIMALLIWFLYKSLSRSLKWETDRMIFSHAYMLAQDEERGRISRELHDTIIQDMRYLLLETEKIGNTDEKIEREYLSNKTVPMMAGLIRKTRDICNELIPPDFRFSELPDALRQLCLEMSKKTGIDCRAEIDENIKLDFLPMEKKLQVYRIVQEALVNIEKHAQAKEAIVTMRFGQSSASNAKVVFIGISDDGIGFKSPLDRNGQIISAIDKSHIGIISMKERAAILGGILRIESDIGEGALVCLEFTIPQNCA
ncbi:MAG: histidine kinase [Treponema sp.]|jgi:signal transduction histidine kinase|nr:histidine kinase [Treponema sp.]